MLLKQVREPVDMAQRRAQVVGDGVRKGLQFLVGGLELGGALDDPLFQLITGPLKRHILLLNLHEHLVEGVHENSHLIFAVGDGADRIVLFSGHGFGRLHQLEQRSSDALLESRRDDKRDRGRGK